jgi:hypothetical protein
MSTYVELCVDLRMHTYNPPDRFFKPALSFCLLLSPIRFVMYMIEKDRVCIIAYSGSQLNMRCE